MPETAQINHMTVAFQTERQPMIAVDDVSFCLRRGETLALLGESGCGKSLTSLALMRLLPENALYGNQSQVVFEQADLLDLSEKHMRSYRGHRIAMIFQEPMTALNPVLTIGQQLSEALPKHLKRRERHAKIITLLKEVEMPDPERRIAQYPHQLSGGQKQRVVIAIALAGNPDILIADEPTTALDVTIQAQILTLLKKLQQEHHMSLLLITHDLGVVKATADRVCVMYAGQVVEMASVDDFFKEPLHPYSQQLLVSIPEISKRNQPLQAIQGNVPTLDAMPLGCRFHPRCTHVYEPCAKEVPELIEMHEGQRQVRCHLYPEHLKPPVLPAPIDVVDTQKHAQTQTSVILSVRNLSVYFERKKHWFSKKKDYFKAVDDLSFELNRGQTLAIVGESGCGKTTTARALLQLQAIQAGDIFFEDESVTHLKGKNLRQFRRKIQIIFQDPFSSMNPRMTVADILAEGMLAQGVSSKKIAQKQSALLDQVNLPQSSLQRYPHQFSGGQRQRICIARALATEPELLVCDEPTSALDISVQAQILNLLKVLQQQYGLSYLFITHDMGVVSYLADEVLVMQDGKKVEQQPCEAIFKNPQDGYTKRLLSSVL